MRCLIFFVSGIGLSGRALQSIMEAALAYLDIENGIVDLFHSSKRQLLLCRVICDHALCVEGILAGVETLDKKFSLVVQPQG